MKDFPGNRPAVKPVLFLDNDFLVDIYGRAPDGAPWGANFDPKLGAAVLDSLSKKYDLRITTTVLAEAMAGKQKFRAKGQWFERNPHKVVIYPTPDFMTGPDKGEKSILSVLSPAGSHYDPTLPPATDPARLNIASRDRKFFGETPLWSNVRSTRVLMEEALLNGSLPRETYDRLGRASGKALRRCGGLRRSWQVMGEPRPPKPKFRHHGRAQVQGHTGQGQGHGQGNGPGHGRHRHRHRHGPKPPGK